MEHPDGAKTIEVGELKGVEGPRTVIGERRDDGRADLHAGREGLVGAVVGTALVDVCIVDAKAS